MNKKHKIVALTPAGRKKYMEVLFPQILKQRDFVDEYHLWVNTKNPEDLAYLNQLGEDYKGFVVLHKDFANDRFVGTNRNITNYWCKAKEQGVVYFRLDDDIVYIEDDYFSKMYEFKMKYPQFIMTTANVVNNAVFDSYRQSEGRVYQSLPKMAPQCMCPVGWKKPEVAELRHREALSYLKEGNKEILYTEDKEVTQGTRFSINTLCWLGDDLADVTVGWDEETYVTVKLTRDKKRSIGVLGSCIACHYAFYTQRDKLSKTNILEEYKKLTAEV